MTSESGFPCGVRIAGTGSAVPQKVLTNSDLAEMMDTSDEWIRKRTGIAERRVCTPGKESAFTLQRDSLRRALDDAGMKGSDLDLIIVASVTNEMTCPSNACRVAAELATGPCGNVWSPLLSREPPARTDSDGILASDCEAPSRSTLPGGVSTPSAQ